MGVRNKLVQVLVLAVLVRGAANAQSVLYSLKYAEPSAFDFGVVEGTGDVDGDGHADLLVGQAATALHGLSEVGRVYLYSGGTGTVLDVLQGDHAFQQFGWSLCGLGDLDFDGAGDFAVLQRESLSANSIARVYSGATRSQLFEVLPPTAGFYDGVRNAGDFDGDGRNDLAVHSEFYGVVVASGASGALLATFTGPDKFGAACEGVGDVDGDGSPELAVGSPLFNTKTGKVELFRSADGSLLYSIPGQGPNTRFGSSVASAGDVDADGWPDWIAGAPTTSDSSQTGAVYVHSGPAGQQQLRFQGGGLEHLGGVVDGAGDLNGDGHADLLVGATPYARAYSGSDGKLLFQLDQVSGSLASAGDVNADGTPDLISMARTPYALVVSGKPLSLVASLYELPLAGGGTQLFRMDFGSAHAGELYFLLGTLSGTTPGQDLGGFQLPLNLDRYFEHTFLHPNAPPLSASLGVLSSVGQAASAWRLPPGLALGVGPLVLHHACVALTPVTLQASAVSTAVPLTLH